MATQASLDLAQQMYVAYYGRPADPAGQLYWAEQFDASEDLTQALAAFGNSDEFTAGFGSLDNEALVTNLFQQLFGRAPEADGLAFYVAKLDSEESTLASIAKEIADGAQNDDKTTLDNRVAVANTYTTAVETQGATYTEAEIADAQAILAAVDATEESVTASNTAAEAEVEANVPVTGETFTLTTGTDDFTLSAGDDTVDGSTPNSLGASDKIIDSSTEDNDTLDVTVSAAVAATVKNVENVNYTWSSNADLAVNATNMAGNTFNLNASGLAFSGNATITAAGTNNVNAGDDITGTLTLTNVVDSTVDAGAAKTVVIDKGAVTTVGQKTTANLTINGDTTLTNTGADEVEVINVTASKAATVTLTNALVAANTLDVAGASDVTVKGAVTGGTITNSLEGGKLTVASTDVAGLNTTKIDADLINITAAAGAVTVADGQKLGVVTATGSLTSITSATANATTDLTTDGNITALDVTGISNFNLDVSKKATIGLTTDDANNVVVTGAGDLTLNSTGVAAIDASALTGKFTYASGNAATGVIGSATAENKFTLTALGAENGTVTGGAADDTFTIGAAATGTLKLDAGAGTGDKLVLSATDAISGAKTTLTGFEKVSAITNTVFTEAQISGQTWEMASTTADAKLIVNVANASAATAVTTDLSKLVFTTDNTINFSTTAITGVDAAVDTIVGTALNDTIDAGGKADIITLGTGADTVVIDDVDGDSTETAYDSVTGFNMSATASVADTIDFATAGVVEVGVVGAELDAVNVADAIKGGTGAEAVTAKITNGIMTLSGVNADQIDSVAELIDAAQLVFAADHDSGTVGVQTAAAGATIGFQFGGNTYLVTEGAGAGTADDAVVELVGVTGATALVTGAGAADSILIG